MNYNSSVLQISNRTNMYPDENDGEPRLEIIEHPKSRGFRFRYTCEGPSHGGIPGASSDKNKKTFPAVKICNYQGYARIVVQLVTNEENPRLHPHSLVGKQCQNGICTVQCGPKDMTATFPNLGIQHVTKKNVANILEERYIAAEMQLSSINDGFPQEVQRNIKDEDRKRIAAKAQSEAKSIDLSVVRLMFIAYLPDSNGAFTIMLKPVISEPIFDSKAPNAATLKICRMDCNAGSAGGGDEVYLLCDKVQKDDIQVRFVEEDMQGNELWENYGNFCPTDVHRQFAIVFRTPPYKDQMIKQPIQVQVQLRRKSDGEVSEPRPFTYLPNKTDFEMIDRKRRKVMPDFLDHVPHGNDASKGYQFGSSNLVSGNIQFQGGNPGGNTGAPGIKQARRPQVKQEPPQTIPLDPAMLLGKMIKQEPRSPASQHFSSSQGSPQSLSSMSNQGSPQAPSPTPDFIPGTQIPMPRAAAVPGKRLPSIHLNQPAQNHILPKREQQRVSGIPLHPQMQPQQMINRIQPSTQLPPNNTFSPQLYLSSPNVTLPGDVVAQSHGQMNVDAGYGMSSPMSTQSEGNDHSSYMDMINPSPSDYINLSQSSQANNGVSYDQNQNSFQTINTADIISEAYTSSQQNNGVEQMNPGFGGGSGSFTNQSYSDPLVNTNYSDLNLSLFSHQYQLTELQVDDLFLNIESDAGPTAGLQPSSPETGDFAGAFKYISDDDDSDTDDLDTPARRNLRSSKQVESDDIEPDSAMETMQRDMNDLHLDSSNLKKSLVAPKKSTDLSAKKRSPGVEVEHENDVQESKKKSKALEKDFKSLERYLHAAANQNTWAMHDYSVTGDVRMLLVLQRNLADVRDENGDSVLHVAVIHDQLVALSAYLDVISTLSNSEEILNSMNKQMQTPLHIAALTDNVTAVIGLLKAGSDPLIADKFGNNAIHVASRHGNADILSRILNSRQMRGKLPEARNHRGLGYFHLAAKANKENRQCLNLLKEHGFDVDMADSKSGMTALHLAAENRNLVVAGCLISECDADVDACTYNGYTPLHVAASNDCNDIATLLLACGADPDASSRPPDNDDEEEDVSCTPKDLAVSEKMKDILDGEDIFNDQDYLTLDDSFTENEDLSVLDPLLKMQLCKMLNQLETGSDWIALADRLDLSCMISYFEKRANPTDSLIENYLIKHGTVSGLRSALVDIGRLDAVQVLNRAILSHDFGLTNDNNFGLTENDRLISGHLDSAIGSLA
ncbi:nuclear factor NF-kappa-B p105 subunit-like isoform X2 [Clavelina lepadiformis]|uniref:nuclear factor NF-kappa-B p105 subunit-like isoform X2 n=1 Tax=Clavelina lepadiformis TaxID=159417 RepID=UPI0040429B72